MAKVINFLGIPVRVVDDDLIDEQLTKPDEPQFYILSRVVDTDPNGGSPQLRARRTRTLCEVCGEICWQDPDGYAEIARLHPTLICSRCMRDKINQHKDAGHPLRLTDGLPKATINELRNQLR